MHLKQLVRAPRYRVFRAWTDPAEIVQWWAPPGSTHTRVEMDLTLNGAVSYRAVTEGRYFQAEGKFTEVEGPLRLAMSWRFRTILMDRWEGSNPPSDEKDEAHRPVSRSRYVYRNRTVSHGFHRSRGGC